MKILAIGDFHREFPKKFNKIIKKEKIDLVISNGDYFPFHYRKLWFKHCFDKDVELWEVIGKKKYKKLVMGDLRDGESALRKLNTLPIPVFTVIGNIDYTRTKPDTIDVDWNKKWKWDLQDFFSKIIKKYPNIKRFDYNYLKFGEFVFIGAYGGTNRGKVTSKAFRKHRKILNKLFKKFRKENKLRKVIFVSHNVPFNTKLDKASMGAHPIVRGKHIGSKLIRRIIQSYQPVLHIGRHMHEAKGIDKIGKTICINSGAAHEGQAAIIKLPENDKEKLKVKFIK